MAKKTKNRQKQAQKKAQKQKKRHERVRKQAQANQGTPVSDIQDKVDYGLGCIENGERKEGKKILDKLKKKYRQNSYVYFGLGAMATFDNNIEKAIQHFTRAVTIKPDFVEAHYNLGVAFQKQMRVHEMIAAYRQVVKHGEPDNDMVVQALDIVNSVEDLIKNDDDGMDLDEYLRASQIFEQGVDFMESQNWEDAAFKFNETLLINPKHVQSYGNLGICYASMGYKQKALGAFDRALKFDPEYEPARVNKKKVEFLKEGEPLNQKVKAINYYKEKIDAQKSSLKKR